MYKRQPENNSHKVNIKNRITTTGMNRLFFNSGDVYKRQTDLEQLRDSEQTMALAYILKYLEVSVMDGHKSMEELAKLIEAQIDSKGLESLFVGADVRASLARPRGLEILGCINRYRM